MEIQLAALTDRGRKRRVNEDRAVAVRLRVSAQPAYLLAVADGVGGAPAGGTASQLAIDTVEHWPLSIPDHPGRSLVAAFEHANVAIVAGAAIDSSRKGMATTLVAAVITGSDWYVANVGDSRAYLCRGTHLTQITRDHSLVAERVKAGLISEIDASHSPQRNVITRSLGADVAPEVDVFDCGRLMADDVVLLCSDGLYTMVPPQEIAADVSSLEPAQAVHHLISRANQLGGDDNIAVAIARVVTPDLPTPPENGRAD